MAPIKFRVYPFNPLIYMTPQTVAITHDTGEEIGAIVCPKRVWGSLSRMSAGVILAAGLGYLLMSILINFGYSGKTVTLLPMAVFLALLIIFPSYLMSKTRLLVKLKKGRHQKVVGFLAPLKFQLPFMPKYKFFDNDGKFTAIIGKNIFFNEFSCTGIKENLLVIPDNDIVADSVMGFGDTFRDNTFSFGRIIDAALNYLPLIKDFHGSLTGKQDHNGFLIFGRNNIQLAHFLTPEFAWKDKNMHCRLTINEINEKQTERLLPVFLAIAIVVSGY